MLLAFYNNPSVTNIASLLCDPHDGTRFRDLAS